VLLGDDDDELVRELGREFEAARLIPGAAPRGWVESVVRHLDDTRSPIAVPLDYRGTPFQVRVWQALREIPPGERRTYSELATRERSKA
jgi:AraC family transcriptional regulator of adaptative response/methylated-DNA-[protein]-cysteine methyltransferase